MEEIKPLNIFIFSKDVDDKANMSVEFRAQIYSTREKKFKNKIK